MSDRLQFAFDILIFKFIAYTVDIYTYTEQTQPDQISPQRVSYHLTVSSRLMGEHLGFERRGGKKNGLVLVH